MPGRSDGLVGEELAEVAEVAAAGAEGELELLGPAVVAVQRVVAVDADAAVEVLRGAHDALAGVGGEVLGDGDLLGRGTARREVPRRLERGEADRLRVDERVRGALADRLER